MFPRQKCWSFWTFSFDKIVIVLGILRHSSPFLSLHEMTLNKIEEAFSQRNGDEICGAKSCSRSNCNWWDGKVVVHNKGEKTRRRRRCKFETSRLWDKKKRRGSKVSSFSRKTFPLWRKTKAPSSSLSQFVPQFIHFLVEFTFPFPTRNTTTLPLSIAIKFIYNFYFSVSDEEDEANGNLRSFSKNFQVFSVLTKRNETQKKCFLFTWKIVGGKRKSLCTKRSRLTYCKKIHDRGRMRTYRDQRDMNDEHERERR